MRCNQCCTYKYPCGSRCACASHTLFLSLCGWPLRKFFYLLWPIHRFSSALPVLLSRRHGPFSSWYCPEHPSSSNRPSGNTFGPVSASTYLHHLERSAHPPTSAATPGHQQLANSPSGATRGSHTRGELEGATASPPFLPVPVRPRPVCLTRYARRSSEASLPRLPGSFLSKGPPQASNHQTQQPSRLQRPHPPRTSTSRPEQLRTSHSCRPVRSLVVSPSVSHEVSL